MPDIPLPGFAVGDSFGNGSTEFPHIIAWPCKNYCVGSYGLVDNIEPAFATNLANRWNGSAFCIIQGGVNDAAAGKTVASMQTAWLSMVTQAQAAGLEVVAVSIAPWKNAATWSAGDQVITDDWNAWLAANADSYGVSLVDIYTPLEGPADELAAAYDSGDGIHPNAAGQDIIASGIDSALSALSLTGTFMSNTYNWRGAVQPAEIEASGNEIKLYRGAVEPQGDDGIYSRKQRIRKRRQMMRVLRR